MPEFISFTKIGQFRNVIREVTDRARYRGMDEVGDPVFDPVAALPELTFTGTVKLHGTNASVCLKGDELWAQSRNNVITPEKDNAGFAQFVESKRDLFRMMLVSARLYFDVPEDETVALFGEWCGPGIQKGVGISELPERLFVIFAVRAGNTYHEPRTSSAIQWLHQPDHRIHNIYYTEGCVQKITIDFANPQAVQNEIVSRVEAVERECPFAAAHGIKGIGEGIVWHANYKDKTFWFKTKGEKHSVSKVKTVAAVDPEVLENTQKFVDYAVTENRLEQGLQEATQGQPLSDKHIGPFLKWVMGDIAKEESDVLAENNLTMKQVSKPCSNKARQWLFAKL